MATTEQFSLRWNNFHSNLTTGFHDLFEASEMVDVTLAVDGHFLQAHKIVLSICSPYFRQMFKANPCKHPIVIMKDIGHEYMKDILEFMYMGEVNVLRENLSAFLKTAELLQVKGLTGDDSSDTSSRKDDKMDAFPDNDEENDLIQYSQLMDSDVELPPQYTPPIVQKRSSKNAHPTSTYKRSKSDCSNSNNNATQTSRTCTKTPDNEIISVVNVSPEDEHETLSLQVKNEKNQMENDEIKDGNRQSIEGSLGSGSTDYNVMDQDVLFYTMDQKMHVFCPYCCRKFVNRYNLKVHIRDKHEDNPINLDCHICGKTMRNRSCLRVHMYHHRKQQMDATLV